MKVYSFGQKIALSAFVAGISWFLYAYFFVIARDTLVSSLMLTLAGLASLEVFVGLYIKLRDIDQGWALIALLLGVAGTLGTAIHGAYDLAVALNPPLTINVDLPNQVDPRGFLAFGLTGFALLKISYLMWVGKKFTQNLSLLGFGSGVLLIIIYLGRLIVLNPAEPILKYPILIEGFLVNPLWYLWIGYLFWTKAKE
ncbi:hypothetical protein HYW55_05535 [Candidatus Gottesmanbacteria bacterium]|nr:hypothetical protein [Candidatus Gottesmanbacteria bacterium]